MELTITDLDRSLAFYTEVLGLAVLRRGPRSATLGVGAEELVVLHEDAGARRPGRESGLYHFALLFPTRAELARVAMRLARTRTPIDGASDHGTHEAIYLADPDEIGLELAADRPRELWPDLTSADFFSHGPAPLDVRSLLVSVADEPPSQVAAPGLKIGHVHLHVGDLGSATRFYRDGLGLSVMTELPTAVFVSFAGYHHHVAYNLWRGPGVPGAAADAVGLRHWTLILVGEAELAAVRDRLTALGFAPSIEADGALLARDGANIAVRIATGAAGD
jgi:catechol 2,3-dioxygenase